MASQPLAKDDPAWSSRDVRLLAGSQMGILGIVMGSFFYSSLMPALEGDVAMSWSASDTTHLVTLANAGCMLGLFAAGPLADYLRPSMLLGCNALVVCTGLFLFALVTNVYHAIAIVCALTFARGVMWPSANVVFATNLPEAKHDTAFLSAAFGSRLGDVLGPLLVAVSMAIFGLSWRWSVLVVLLAVLLSFGISAGVVPQNLKEPEATDRFTLEGLAQKMLRLVADLDGWLVFVSNLGTYGVWSLYDYAAVLAADTYHLSPGQAAGANAYMSFGSAVGLAVAFFASNILGTDGGRMVHVVQSASSAVALSFLASGGFALLSFHMLLFLVGFGFVAISYVPFMIYAARSRADERALRISVIDGVGQLCGVGFTYMYGTLRAEQGQRGASSIFAIAAASMSVATVTLATYYARLHTQEHRELVLAGRTAESESSAP